MKSHNVADLAHLDREKLTLLAEKNVRNTLTLALQHDSKHTALVVYDAETDLAKILTEAYRRVLPHAKYIDFNTVTKEEVIAAFDVLSPRDLVVLIQSTDFRLNEFRIRIYLFQKKLKVVDHMHLFRNEYDSYETYIKALEYDPVWYREVGYRLKAKLEASSTIKIQAEGMELIVEDGVEIPKLNVGDYTGMENIGGTFPIGEVFTEARDLSKVNGSLMIYAFAGTDFNITMHKPFRIDVKEGLVVSWDENAPELFGKIVEQVATNERPIIREIGFGLNRAITKEHYLKDITAFERNLGLHVSLGEKHTVYKKQGITPDKTRYHVDLFLVVTSVLANDEEIFNGTTYTI